MDVEQIYFLMLIGVCIALLIAVVWGLEKKHQQQINARKEKARKKALRQQRRAPVRRGVNIGHTESIPPYELIARGSQQRGAEDSLDDSFAASGLFSDDEKPDEQPARIRGDAAPASDGERARKFRSWS